MAKAAKKSEAKSKAKPAKPVKAAKPTKPAKAAKVEKKPVSKAAKAPEKGTTAKAKTLPPPPNPGRLGQKRACPKCQTKFYDFERNPITCPKCLSEFEPSAFEIKIPLKSEPKKAKPIEKEEEAETVVVTEASEDFESIEELSDAEDIPDDLAAANTDGGDSYE